LAVKLYEAKSSPLYQSHHVCQGSSHALERRQTAFEAIAQIAAWIDNGAPYDAPLRDGKTMAKKGRSSVTASDRQWWAFLPLKKFIPPGCER